MRGHTVEITSCWLWPGILSLPCVCESQHCVHGKFLISETLFPFHGHSHETYLQKPSVATRSSSTLACAVVCCILKVDCVRIWPPSKFILHIPNKKVPVYHQKVGVSTPIKRKKRNTQSHLSLSPPNTSPPLS